MEKKNVIVSIQGTQTQFDDTSNVELYTEGVFYKEDSKYIVVYEETEMTGLSGTTTTLEISDDKVALIRNGAVNNQMLFIKNKKTTSYYETQFGSLIVGILSDKVDIDIDEDGGIIDINYIIDINEEYTGENRFLIKIKNA